MLRNFAFVALVLICYYGIIKGDDSGFNEDFDTKLRSTRYKSFKWNLLEITVLLSYEINGKTKCVVALYIYIFALILARLIQTSSSAPNQQKEFRYSLQLFMLW